MRWYAEKQNLQLAIFVVLPNPHGFLWIKKVSYTWIHNHKKAVSTWTHAERVMENEYLTLKQKQKNNATAKISFFLNQMCGNSKMESPT